MGSVEHKDALDLLSFWLSAGPAQWFKPTDAFDAACVERTALWEQAKDGARKDWANTAAGALALIVLLDQIPRNAFRGTAKMYATDALALDTAQAAIAAGHDRAFPMPCKFFFYLPLEHAEDVAIQRQCLDLVRPLADQNYYYWALVHADAITRFGRFPHRNALLGRQTTAEERAYMESGGFSA